MPKEKRELWVLDSETDPFTPDPTLRIPIAAFIWGAYNGSAYFEFNNADEVTRFFHEKHALIYAHNGGRFDYHLGILESLPDYEPLMLINGRIVQFEIGLTEYRDSYSILPLPMRAFQKCEFDYSKMERKNRTQHMTEIRAYLRSDCVNLYDMVSQFEHSYGRSLTLAGAAMRQWQRIQKSKPPKSTAEYYHSVLPYYHGGRVEAYEIGQVNGPLTVVDINSAYPYAMMHKHPVGPHSHLWSGNDITDPVRTMSTEQIQGSFFTIESESLGAFPWRASPNHPLQFPRDQVRRIFHVSGWEILAARDTHTLGDYTTITGRTYGQHIAFDQYVDHFYKLKAQAKLDGDNTAYQFAKLFLNSLYGKFGSNPERYKAYWTCPVEALDDAINEAGMSIAGFVGNRIIVSEPIKEDDQRFYDVAVSASITGFVRAYLHRAIKSCGDGQVVYCDTDSIVTRTLGDSITIGPALGQWEIEANNCPHAWIAAKKLYTIERQDGTHKSASKGIKLTPAKIMRVAMGETIQGYAGAPSMVLPKAGKPAQIFTDRKITRACLPSYVVK